MAVTAAEAASWGAGAKKGRTAHADAGFEAGSSVAGLPEAAAGRVGEGLRAEGLVPAAAEAGSVAALGAGFEPAAVAGSMALEPAVAPAAAALFAGLAAPAVAAVAVGRGLGAAAAAGGAALLPALAGRAATALVGAPLAAEAGRGLAVAAEEVAFAAGRGRIGKGEAAAAAGTAVAATAAAAVAPAVAEAAAEVAAAAACMSPKLAALIAAFSPLACLLPFLEGALARMMLAKSSSSPSSSLLPSSPSPSSPPSPSLPPLPLLPPGSSSGRELAAAPMPALLLPPPPPPPLGDLPGFLLLLAAEALPAGRASKGTPCRKWRHMSSLRRPLGRVARGAGEGVKGGEAGWD